MKITTLIITVLLLTLLISSLELVSQNIAITDDDTYNANSSAMLDVKSLTKGMLVPRLTTTQRNAVSNPATGLLVFDTDVASFYFYNGTLWTNLSSGNANGIIGYTSPDKVYLKDITDKFGVGTVSPSGKMEVKSDISIGNELPIFNVVNSTGDTVFAVYEQGVRINVYDDPLAKANTSKGGFAVGGFSPSKGTYTNEYLRISPDSIRMYIEEGAVNKANTSKGGFAVGGFSPSKTVPTDYFNIYGSNTTTTLNPSESRIFWYPLKEALLSGRVLVESPDSVGTNSFATGFESKAIGDYSQAFGYHARAKGNNSTAIGNYANAVSNNSFALGDSAQALGIGSYAFGSVGRNPVTGLPTGIPTRARGNYSLAFGLGAQADTIAAFAIGNEANAQAAFSMSLGYQSTAKGLFSIALGYKANAQGTNSTALGSRAWAGGSESIALGVDCYASQYASFAAGEAAYATGQRATALGSNTVASGNYATAMGALSEASGYASLAVGESVAASGQASFAFGQQSSASGDFSLAGGYQTFASNLGAFSTGYSCLAGGISSVSLGFETQATGNYSFSFGKGIHNSGSNSVVYAINDQTGTTVTDNNVFVIMGGKVGIGTISPQYTLDVAGGINVNNGISTGVALAVNNSSLLSENASYYQWGNTGKLNYFANYIGIGTTAPARPLHVSGNAQPAARFRISTDGTLMEFYSGAFMRGSISIAGATTSYNAFTGSHYASVPTGVEKGLIMKLTGENTFLNNNPESEIIYGTDFSSEPNSAEILGAYLGKEDFDGDNSPSLVMAVGNGVMWVVDNGENLKIGDYLITANVSGHAMKDIGSYEVANIIARIAEPVDWINITSTINGKKHKLVSVFFENFKLEHNETKIKNLENRVEKLEKLLIK